METPENKPATEALHTASDTQPENLVSESQTSTDSRFREAYITYLLEHGTVPASIYKFSKSLGFAETEFYKYYNNFAQLERDIWKQFFVATAEVLEAEPTYRNYTVREKLLAFYYTLVQQLLGNRSYVLIALNRKHDSLRFYPTELDGFKTEFVNWAVSLVNEGKDKGEIVNRPFVSDKYGDALWLQLLFVLNFWVKDDSIGFEKTDAAIEKAVNLSMDIMGRNYLDSAFDFAKFLFQNRKL